MSESQPASTQVTEQTPAPVEETKPTTETNNKETPAASSEPTPTENAEASDKQPATPTFDLPLESQWSFWYSTKPAPDEKFDSKLRQLGSFQTLQGFKDIYAHLESPSELPKDANYALFRNTHKPMWETFPHGGCWNVHLVKNNHDLPLLWEKLVLAAIGETFGYATMVGVAVSRRAKEDVLSVWLRSPKKSIRFDIGSTIKEVLDSPSITIEYKDHKSSIKDRSTYHNGKFYTGSAKGRKSQKERRRKNDKKAAAAAKEGAQASSTEQQEKKPEASTPEQTPSQESSTPVEATPAE